MNQLVEEIIKPILEANPKIKKVVGIYGGRFQPFGPHHYKTYKWLKAGLSVKEQEPLLSVGFNKKFKKYWLEYNIGISAKTDFEDNNIFNIKSEVKRWVGKYNIFGLYKHEYYNNKEDFQFKVGVGVEI